MPSFSPEVSSVHAGGESASPGKEILVPRDPNTLDACKLELLQGIIDAFSAYGVTAAAVQRVHLTYTTNSENKRIFGRMVVDLTQPITIITADGTPLSVRTLSWHHTDGIGLSSNEILYRLYDGRGIRPDEMERAGQHAKPVHTASRAAVPHRQAAAAQPRARQTISSSRSDLLSILLQNQELQPGAVSGSAWGSFIQTLFRYFQ